MKQLFATTARGFEELLKSELTELGAQDAKVAARGRAIFALEPFEFTHFIAYRASESL